MAASTLTTLTMNGGPRGSRSVGGVIRFWNNDILANIDGVQEMILEQLRNPLPPSPGRAGPLPLPRAGEGLEQAGEGL